MQTGVAGTSHVNNLIVGVSIFDYMLDSSPPTRARVAWIFFSKRVISSRFVATNACSASISAAMACCVARRERTETLRWKEFGDRDAFLRRFQIGFGITDYFFGQPNDVFV